MASYDGLTREQLIQRARSMTADELVELVDRLAGDLETAERIMNTQATAFGWCGEYEERVDKYNNDFDVFSMDGRLPQGRRLSTRNAFAARRMIMGHIISTCARHGIDLPEGAYGGVVRDHRALDDAHEVLLKTLRQD